MVLPNPASIPPLCGGGACIIGGGACGTGAGGAAAGRAERVGAGAAALFDLQNERIETHS